MTQMFIIHLTLSHTSVSPPMAETNPNPMSTSSASSHSFLSHALIIATLEARLSYSTESMGNRSDQYGRPWWGNIPAKSS